MATRPVTRKPKQPADAWTGAAKTTKGMMNVTKPKRGKVKKNKSK